MSTKIQTDVVTLAKILKKIAESDTPVEHAPERQGEVRRSSLNAAKAAKLFGWAPTFTIEDGLADTYRWFAENTVTT